MLRIGNVILRLPTGLAFPDICCRSGLTCAICLILTLHYVYSANIRRELIMRRHLFRGRNAICGNIQEFKLFLTFSLYSSQWKTSMHACDIDRDHGPLLRFLICPCAPDDEALEQEDEECLF